MAEAPQIVVGRPGHGEGRRAEVGRGSVPAKRSLGFEILSWLATLAVAVVASLLTAVGLALYFGPVVVLLFAAGVIVLLSAVALLEERFMGVVLAVIGIVAALYATPYALVLTAAGLARSRWPGRCRSANTRCVSSSWSGCPCCPGCSFC